jgi:hypothetical protein
MHSFHAINAADAQKQSRQKRRVLDALPHSSDSNDACSFKAPFPTSSDGRYKKENDYHHP